MGSYSDFTKRVKKAVREKAAMISNFIRDPRIDGEAVVQGCLRITTCPLCQEAYEWAGGSEEFDPDDIPDVEDAYALLPGADRVAKFLDDKGNVEVYDTYAVTAMKIAKLSRIQESIPDCLLSGYVDESDVAAYTGKPAEVLLPENGFAKWRGAICCVVECPPEKPGDKPKPYCWVYISVSGAEEDDDLACAMASIDAIMQYFANDELDVIAPVVPT